MPQAISLALDIFWPAALLSAAVAFALARLFPRLLPTAAVVAFFAGYLTLSRTWAALVPSQEFHWLPYLGFAAAATALAENLPAKHQWLRWTALVGLALLAACVLTPSWPVFGLTRPLSIGIAFVYFLLIAAPLTILPTRLVNPSLPGLLSLAAAVTAVAIGIQVSLRFAQLSGLAAGSFAGAWLAGFASVKPTESSIRGLIPVFTVLVGGIAFIACVEPDPPVRTLLALPFTPLLQWLWVFLRPPPKPGDPNV